MSDENIKKLISIKQSFSNDYSGNAHIQEVIPLEKSELFTIDSNHLSLLHEFARQNPIYFNSYQQKIQSVNCTVYEGDINEYWLNSIKHGSSCQPFYPTWMISAYFMAKTASDFGFNELVDIGSGDGRIAFCGKIFGLASYSIEIDEQLVDLQKIICKSTDKNFNPTCHDALEFDYTQLDLTNPIFFIGSLPQMGGDVLADGIIEKLCNLLNSECIGVVFAGTDSKRQLSTSNENGGWSSLIEKYNLKVIDTISLPTIWTFDQKVETPYIFTKLKRP